MIWHYLYTFAQTNFLELPFYYLVLRRRVDFRTCLLVVTFGNLLTHPLVFFGFLGSSRSYFASTLSAEVFAPVVEAIVIALATRASWKQAFGASLLSNFISWQIAPIVTYALFF